jgi:penicillin-binding protein-related factor A (putative recombinase)
MTTNQQEMTIAKLDEAKLAKLHSAEKEMGIVLVALQPHYLLANLNEQQVKHLQKLEQELGVVLLAYQKR